MTGSGVPKIMGQIWIGDRKAPEPWMKSWKASHPSWEYVVYDNTFLTSRRWFNHSLILEYFKRREFAGVSDLIRYEILYERGGFIPEADSVCLRPVDELFSEPKLYTVYENEERRPGFVHPFLASNPGNPGLHMAINILNSRYGAKPEKLDTPFRSVGNRFLERFIRNRKPDVTVFPSFMFNPVFHKEKFRYVGDGPVYANHKWGTTHSKYEEYEEAERRSIFEAVVTKLEQLLTSEPKPKLAPPHILH